MIGVKSCIPDARNKRVAAEAALLNVSLYKIKKVVFDAPYIRIAKVIDANDIFTVELLHFFHLHIPKRLKEYTMV